MSSEIGRITAEVFVDVVFEHAFESAVEGTFKVIEDPPGRMPPSYLLEMHDWYDGLDEADRAHVRRVSRYAAESAVFGVLCLLDNVRPVVDGYAEEMQLNVRTKDGERPLRSDGIELHGLFNDRSEVGR